VLPIGEATTVALTVRNDGHAVVRGLTADLQPGPALSPAGGGPRRTLDLLRPQTEPQTEETLTWRVTADGQSPAARLQVAVRAGNAEGGRAAAELVLGPPIPAIDRVPDRATAEVIAGTAVIGNARLRMLFPRAEFGYGIGVVQRRTAGGWQTVATLPRLTRLVVAGADDRVLAYADSASPVAPADGAACALELAVSVTDGNGVSWQVAEAVSLFEAPDRFGLRVTASSSRPAQVLALDGPIVCVGEGAPEGTRRLDAIFPGLEWLVVEQPRHRPRSPPPHPLRPAPAHGHGAHDVRAAGATGRAERDGLLLLGPPATVRGRDEPAQRALRLAGSLRGQSVHHHGHLRALDAGAHRPERDGGAHAV